MKKRVVTAGVCLTLALMLSGCSAAKQEAEPQQPASDVELVQQQIDEDLPDGPFYVLLLGLDTRAGTIEGDGGRASYSDTIVLARVDPTTYHIGLVSIPRDTAADINGTHGKVNDAYYVGGPEGAVQAVEQLTGVDIRYYMSATFATFVDFVNNLGGVDGYVPMYMTLQDIVSGNNIELYEGEQHLDGAQSLVWVRQRKQYPYEGEACRQQNARAFLQAAIGKVVADPAAAAGQVDNLLGHVETDIPASGLAKMATDFCAHADQLSFVSGSGPYIGDINPENELWEIARDEDTYHRIIQAVEAHENPQEIVANPL